MHSFLSFFSMFCVRSFLLYIPFNFCLIAAWFLNYHLWCCQLHGLLCFESFTLWRRRLFNHSDVIHCFGIPVSNGTFLIVFLDLFRRRLVLCTACTMFQSNFFQPGGIGGQLVFFDRIVFFDRSNFGGVLICFFLLSAFLQH